MKKTLSILLLLAMLMALCACGADNKDNQPDSTPQSTSPVSTQGQLVLGYVFVYKNAELTPGAEFQPDKLPEPQYHYTAPNCALDGDDTIYNYTDIEVAVYNDGKTSVIQSVYIINPNLTTPEGLALGDDLAKVKTLYGDSYTTNGAEWLFQKGDMVLAILTQDDFVASVEYRLAG